MLFGPVDEDNPTEEFTFDAATLAQLDYISRDAPGSHGAEIERLIHRTYAQIKNGEDQDAADRAYAIQYGYAEF